MQTDNSTAPAFQIVDAHQHFWDLQSGYRPWLNDDPPIPFRYGDYSALRHNFLPHHYRTISEDQNIRYTVHVETEWDPEDGIAETDWLQQLNAETGLPTVIVAQAWLDRDDAATRLAEQAARSLVRGVRHKPKAAASPDHMIPRAPGSMADPRWRDGYQLLKRLNLSFDLQTPYWHLSEACELLADFPDTLLVLNHTGLPADRSRQGLSAWHQAMQALSQFDNAVVKISGLGIAGEPWRVSDHADIIRQTIALFGTTRVMFASNFPVDGIVAGITRDGFNRLFNGFKSIARDFTLPEQRAMFFDNAWHCYRMAEAAKS